jgi:excisionase family DNA binding protein
MRRNFRYQLRECSDDRLVGAKELAARLGIGLRTVYRWVRRGVLPRPLRLTARAVRWRWGAVKEFFAALEIGPAKPAGEAPAEPAREAGGDSAGSLSGPALDNGNCAG